MSTPSVTIIIPVYNDAATLAACLRGLLAHTDYPDWDVLVVDDGSTDGSRQVLREFKRVRFLKKLRGGVASALNAGFAAVPGRDIVRLHADVVIETPGWLGKLVAAATSQPQAGVVGVRLVYPDGRIESEGRAIVSGFGFHPRHRPRCAFQAETAAGRLLEVDSVSGALAYYRREVIDRVGGLDENYGPAWFEDDDFCFGARRLGFKVYIEPAVRAVHYTRANPPTFTAYFPNSETTLSQLTHKFKEAGAHIQAEYWERKWGWHPFHPDVNEIRRLYGTTEICWQIGEKLRFKPSSDFPSVDCCFVTWNALPLLKRMLESLARTDYPANRLKVYIANNGSTDATLDHLKSLQAAYPFPIQIIDLAVNTGVAAGLNFAMTAGSGELVARLDDDIILPPDWLNLLLRDLVSRPFAGCVGTKTVSDDDRRAIQWACPHSYPVGYNHRDEADDGHADYLARVSNIHGCCNLYRRDTLVRCGLIDIRYSPSQYDDIDHHMALINAGYEVLYNGRVSVIHKINNGLDRSAAGLASGAANANKMFGKWGRDVFEILDTAILLSREGRYLPEDGDTGAWLASGPSAGEFPRALAAEPKGQRLLMRLYEELNAGVAEGSELHLLCDDHLGLARLKREAGNARDALDVVLAAANFSPFRPDVYRTLADLYGGLGLSAMASAAGRRGLHLSPDDAGLREWAAITARQLFEREQQALVKLRAARPALFQEVGGADRSLRVLFVTAFQPGLLTEDLKSARGVAEKLKEVGIEADVCSEARPNPAGYDLIHAVGMALPDQTLSQLKALRVQAPAVPVVFTPAYRDRREAVWAATALTSLFGKAAGNPALLEQSLASFAAGKISINGENRPVGPSAGAYLRPSELFQRGIFDLVDHLFLSWENEGPEIAQAFATDLPFTLCSPGVDVACFTCASPDAFVRQFGLRDFVLVVGPLTGAENQLMLLQALRAGLTPVVLVGPQPDVYYRKLCQQVAPPGSLFVEQLAPDMLASAYKAAGVVALPRWSQLPSTAMIEAALAGRPLVLADRPDERKIGGSAAHYCDPASLSSIRAAVHTAMTSGGAGGGKRQQLSETLATRHTWPAVLEQMLKGYEIALASRASAAHAA